jgi:alanyl-tRNA synthetase
VRAKELLATAQRVGDATLIVAQLDGADRDFLAAMADALRGQMRGGVAVLVSVPDPSTVAWVMAVTEDLATRVHAGKLLKAIAAITGGGGGGRPEFAQAGGKDPSKIAEALSTAQQLVRDALGAR